jgi:hypothetical protein
MDHLDFVVRMFAEKFHISLVSFAYHSTIQQMEEWQSVIWLHCKLMLKFEILELFNVHL